MKVRCVPLKEKDREEAVELLTAAFEQDPCFTYYANSKDVKRKRKRIAACIEADLHLYLSEKHIVHGLVKDDRLVGVAFMQRPNQKFHIATLLSSANIILTKAGLPVLLRILRAHACKAPSGNAYYLAEIGILPEEQGKGYGTMLLTQLHRRADKEKKGITLITENAKNIPYYKKRGYSLETIFTRDRLTKHRMRRPLRKHQAL